LETADALHFHSLASGMLLAPDQAKDQDSDAKQHPEKARHGHAHGGPEHGLGRILAETAAWAGLAEPTAALPRISREPHKDDEDKGGDEGSDQRQRRIEPCRPS
jgi:hypothetical protein